MAQLNNRSKIDNNQQVMIRCIQINLQHSRVATDNLMNLIQQDHTDIVFVQEPYLLQNKIAGITRTHSTYISSENRSRAAIIITNENIDAVLINQLCDRDNVVLELKYKNIRIFAAGMYLDINEEIDTKTEKVDDIIQLSKGSGILIAMDSNSRSKVWHDNQTNLRGKTLEEILTSRDLHIVNEESERTTFQSCRGSSNIDLTVINKRLLKTFHDWEISEDESCSDHNIIKFKLGNVTKYITQHNHNGLRYIIQEKTTIDLIKI